MIKCIFKSTGTSAWGKSSSNDGYATLFLNNQNYEGNFVIDSDSELTIRMINSTIKGEING